MSIIFGLVCGFLFSGHFKFLMVLVLQNQGYLDDNMNIYNDFVYLSRTPKHNTLLNFQTYNLI